MRQQTASRGHFQQQLADRAKLDEFAAPLAREDLPQRLDYLPRPEIRRVLLAYKLAEQAHRGQSRHTGHAYITHPLAVVDILADMRMDHESLMAGLLHDVLEDCGIDKRSLAGEFGDDVANIVDGVSKLSRYFDSHHEAQAENFRKLAMAFSRDLRVILVKLADRLHNMRTIGVMSRDDRKRIARETLELYAPIANRLGIYRMRVELENLSFEALYPLRADRLQGAVETNAAKRSSQLELARDTIQATLKREGIAAELTSHRKHLYSIYQAMRRERKPFSELMDVFGFRVVVDQVDTCYRVLGSMHNLYRPQVRHFRDFIAIPKPNGYQSLHTTLFGEGGTPIEIQIRTRQMDATANYGIAGDWLYTNDPARPASDNRLRKWIGGMLDMQRTAGNTQEFLRNLKTDLFPEGVFVFTPKGDIVTLPVGSCPVDFAYAIHTDVGNQCVGCKVDRVPAPLSHKLDSGETVEVSTDKNSHPDPDWLSFAVSGKARTGILDALKRRSDHESRLQGSRLLNRALASAGTSIRELDFRRLRKVFNEFDVKRRDELFVEIGKGNLLAFAVAQRLLDAGTEEFELQNIDEAGPFSVRGGQSVVLSFAKCCGPVPGDSIVGLVSRGEGLKIHVATCATAVRALAHKKEEVIPTRWAEKTHGEFEVFLIVFLKRLKGAFADLANTLNNLDVGFNKFVIADQSATMLQVSLDLAVRDVAHLERAVQRVTSLPAVENVRRKAG